MKVLCPYCDRLAVLTTGAVIYPHRTDLAEKRFWWCAPCDAYVGCHPQHRKWSPHGITPLGRLANAELRREKQRAHAAFDPMWKSGGMSRTEAYQWLAGQLGMSASNCHIGALSADGCRAVVTAVQVYRGEKVT